MPDITIKCECGNEFTFTERDQEFFKKMGFTTPKRCRICRAKHKAQFKARDARR